MGTGLDVAAVVLLNRQVDAIEAIAAAAPAAQLAAALDTIRRPAALDGPGAVP